MTTIQHCILPKQFEFIASDAPSVLYSGAWRAGKSRALCYKIAARAAHKGAVEGLCRKHLSTLKSSTLRTLLEPDGDLPPVLPPGSYTHNKVERFIKIKGGGLIYYFGFGEGDRGSQKIGSLGFTGCAVDEAVELTKDNWMWCESRLSVDIDGLCRQIYGACNPGTPLHYLAKMFGLALGEKADPGCYAIKTETADNPYLPQDYLDRINRLTGVSFNRYVKGLWVGSDGMVYDLWDRDAMVCERDEQWSQVIIGMDAGYNNPAVMLVIGIDNDGNMHVLNEWYKTKQIEPDIIKEARLLHEAYGVEAFIYDPSAAALAAGMRAQGLHMQAAQNDIQEGLQSVRSRLVVSGDGRHRLSVDPSCENLIREFESYENKKDPSTGMYTDVPKKENDHAMDALRYAIVSVDGLGAVPVSLSVTTQADEETQTDEWLSLDNDEVWE